MNLLHRRRPFAGVAAAVARTRAKLALAAT